MGVVQSFIRFEDFPESVAEAFWYDFIKRWLSAASTRFLRGGKRAEDGMIMVCCHVDDLFVVGKEKDAERFFENLGKELKITYKEVDGATKYLGRHLEKQGDGYVFGVVPT